jgi:hypothetical protein
MNVSTSVTRYAYGIIRSRRNNSLHLRSSVWKLLSARTAGPEMGKKMLNVYRFYDLVANKVCSNSDRKNQYPLSSVHIDLTTTKWDHYRFLLVRLLNIAVSTVAVKQRRWYDVDEWWIGKDLDGNNCGFVRVLFRHSPEQAEDIKRDNDNEWHAKQSSLAKRHTGVKGESEYSFYSFLTSVLDAGEWSASRPGLVYPRGKNARCPLYRRLGGPQSWSGHRG